jgi:Subtilase family
MRGSARRRSVVVCATATLIFALVGLGVALASASRRSGPFTRGAHRGLSAKTVLARGRNTSSRVIVILRNQVAALPASKGHIAARIRAEAASDAQVVGQVQSSGGRIYNRYHGLNAFAARVSSVERSTLEHSAAVSQVVPDTVVTLPGLESATANRNAAAGAASTAQQVCPADPSKPLLEPEALQTTHTAFSDPAIPQAQDIATGQGVRVAFFADGLDINNPDLIRSDGQQVITDYQNFTGDGEVTNSLEAFGDASSIAAQGNQVYDLSNFVNPAHPLPAGCNIKIRGIAPGASLVAMKVFGNSDSSFNSVILQGLDYALTNEHVNVMSESFGGYPIPDSTQDLTRQFNEQAVAAGVTVVESTGDSGVEASPSSASSDPSVIAAGASTTFQNYAQGTQYGAQFTNGWLSDNISSIESAGFTQGGRVLDLVAPGEANWALCSTDTAIYTGCVNYAGEPTNLESFGGTSESAPFIAGGAALVIQAYEQTHAGVAPSPALVRQLLTSTATDLHAPGDEEGAGEMNTLAAVQAAESIGRPSGAVGQNLLVGPTQLDLSGQAGSSFNEPVQVSNLGTSAQTVTAHVRQIAAQLANQTGSVTLDASSPTFVDQFGNSVPYERISFHVPAGADRLVSFLSWNGPLARVGLTLIDPTGKLAAYTRPQGDGNHGEVDVADPVAGTWTGLIFRRDGTFTGPVLWQATSQRYGDVDSVSPSSVTLAPGQTRTIRVSSSFPSAAGDSNQDLVLSASGGSTSIVPIALRSLVALGFSGGQFNGNLIGGNGRNGAFQPGQIDTYEFDVPRGKPELTVGLSFTHSPGTEIFGSLISPDGLTVTDGDNALTNADGNSVYTTGLQAYTPSPQAGRWRFVVDIINPIGGQELSAPYQGRIGFFPPPILVTGLPNSASRMLPTGQAANVTVRMRNNGVGTESVYLDARTTVRQNLSLLSLTPDTDIALPIAAGQNPPLYPVPTETNAIDAVAQASLPVTFDFGYGDPDLSAISSGDSASGAFQGPATPGIWDIAPDPIGPFGTTVVNGTVSTGMVAHTLGFDPDVTSSTGDIEAEKVDPNASAFTPLTLAPGQNGAMSMTITPSAKKGKRVRGTLFVDVFDNRFDVSGEIAALPYEYTVK